MQVKRAKSVVIGEIGRAVDDALFTALDVSGGYVDENTAFANFGIKALSSMASAAVGGVFNGFDPGAVSGAAAATGASGAGGFMKTGLNGMVSTAFGSDADALALMKGSELFASGAVGSAASAFTYSKEKGWDWDFNRFAEGTFGTSAMAGYAGGMLSSGIKTDISNSLSIGDNKLYSGAIDLAGSLTGEAAKYGVYFVSQVIDNPSLGFRDTAKTAFDKMGGLTFNIANLGAILDLSRTFGIAFGGNYDPSRANSQGVFIDRYAGNKRQARLQTPGVLLYPGRT